MLGSLSEAGWSQVTLVDTTTFGEPQTVISFIRDDMKNTKILSFDESLLYSVQTDKETGSRTVVLRGETDEIVAELKRKDLSPDTIKWGEGAPIKLSAWLRGAKGRWSDFPATFEHEGTKYTWRPNKLNVRQIALYGDDEPDTPIAWFQTSKKAEVDGIPTIYRALLALRISAYELLDNIVMSLLIVEQGLRLKEMKYRNADGRNTFKHSI